MKISYIVMSVGLLISACTWVNENQAGKKVAITVIDAVADCTFKGNVQVNVLHKLGFIPRSGDKVTRELQTLARNEAVKLGANALVAKGPPAEGKQAYTAYLCN